MEYGRHNVAFFKQLLGGFGAAFLRIWSGVFADV